MSNPWAGLDIPDTWTATSMLQSMAADHLAAGESSETGIDDVTRERMVGLAIMSQLEVAAKVAGLSRIVQQLVELLPDGSEGGPLVGG